VQKNSATLGDAIPTYHANQ